MRGSSTAACWSIRTMCTKKSSSMPTRDSAITALSAFRRRAKRADSRPLYAGPTCGQPRRISGARHAMQLPYNSRLLAERVAMMLKKLVAGLSLIACGAACADEASVRKLVEAKLGNKVQRVTKTPYGGLYEVYV